jgi:hypothetical protein
VKSCNPRQIVRQKCSTSIVFALGDLDPRDSKFPRCAARSDNFTIITLNYDLCDIFQRQIKIDLAHREALNIKPFQLPSIGGYDIHINKQNIRILYAYILHGYQRKPTDPFRS